MSSSRAMPSFTWLTLDRCSNCQGCRVSALEVEYTQVEGFAMCIWWLHRTGFIAQQTLSVGIFARCDAVMVMVRAVGAVPKEKEVSVITPQLRQKRLTANHFDIWQCRKRTQPTITRSLSTSTSLSVFQRWLFDPTSSLCAIFRSSRHHLQPCQV